MIYITRQEITNALQSCSIDEITSYKQRILDFSESFAVEMVKSYLTGNYDMDYELRPIEDYNVNVIYPDNQRIRITSNQTNFEFSEQYGIELIDSPLYVPPVTEPDLDPFYSNFDPKDDSPTEEILVVKPNSCPAETIRVPIKSYIDKVEQYQIKDNPLYSESCGIITCSNGVISSGYINNLYNTIYNIDDTLTTIDYSVVDISTANTYLNNIQNFDQYLLLNKDRDFNPDDRNVIIKQLVLDITVHNLVQRIHPRQVSETIVDRYNSAIDMLKQIQRGDISINLKKYEGTEEFQNHQAIRWGISKSGLRNSY